MQLSRLAIENHQFTTVAFLAFLILGVGAIMNMPTSEDPPINPPGVTIVVFYPGTSPINMENLIVEPLESEINEIEDIKEFKTKIENGSA